MALPFLPGNSFTDPTKTKFHRPQTLAWQNGYVTPRMPSVGIGGDPIPINQLTSEELDELANFKPTMTYGQAVQAPPEDFVPAHVGFDKKVLLFHAYFKQTVHESPNESYRVRPVKIYYYLEDDSIAVIEPVVENSGIPQGKLIKRQQLPKSDLGETWHWKDLNLGNTVTFYGKTFLIHDCNQWTKDFMESEGIELNQPVTSEKDPYAETRQQPRRTYSTPSTFDKLKQFMDMDRQVLRFYCLWDDRESMFGEMRPYILHYYLVDDTMEIREVRHPNDGRDPFPILIGRQRMPKDRSDVASSFPSCVMEMSEHEVKDWFTPADFMTGKTVSILGRRFLLYDCDQFTQEYYEKNMGISDFTPVQNQVHSHQTTSKQQEIPPYNGFGSLEDSLQSCLSLVPQPPKKDFIKMLENDNKVLRYEAVLDSVKTEEKNRRFIISYRLADDMITIYEPPQRNSGVLGGKFLERTRVRKPKSSIDNPEFYSPGDFYIGAIITIFKHRFTITDADEYVVKYLEAFPHKYPQETINSIRDKLQNKSNGSNETNSGKSPAEHGVNSEHQWRYKGNKTEYKWRA